MRMQAAGAGTQAPTVGSWMSPHSFEWVHCSFWSFLRQRSEWASHTRGSPPAVLLQARPPALVTLWAFETNVTQAPPLPIAGCALDDFVPKNCWAPLQKQVRSRVRLMAIF